MSYKNRDLEQNVNTSNATKYNVSDGENINITSAGVYVISGSAKNVTIYVEAGDLDKVEIVLENLSTQVDTARDIIYKLYENIHNLIVTADMVGEGAAVIDVGVNRDPATGKLCGDVDFEGCKDKASVITPVPGGCGPMTRACLMENTVECYLNQVAK